ncbi:MAG: NAD(P)-dependent oxidoreductase [Rhodospirillales bacterium]|nr:NAD(P)-dependent oxidoreductase [Rhodospirillales bacterium]
MNTGLSTVVFGGAGFIGLNIAERLLGQGAPVVIFDANPIPGKALETLSALPGRLTFIQGDILDDGSIRSAFENPVDAVVYGAAVTADAARDAADPELIVEVNLVGFIRALRAARDAGVRRVVNLSSVGAYGDAVFGGGALEEDATKADPVSMYSLTKFSSERAGARLGHLWNMSVCSVRLSGIFGRWEWLTSARDTPSPHFQVMQRALRGEPALFARRDRRDWTYATDVANAVDIVIDAAKLSHRLYNLSGNAVVSAFEWGQRLAEIRSGFECRLTENGEAPTIDLYGPEDRQPMDVTRLLSDTDYVAQFDTRRSVEDYDAWTRINEWAFSE